MANDYTEFLQGFKGNQNTKSIEEKYEDKIKSLKSDLEDRDANIKTLKKDLDEAQDEIKKLRIKYENSKQKNKDKDKEIEVLKEKLKSNSSEADKEKIKQLQETCEKMKNNYDDLEKQILELKKSSHDINKINDFSLNIISADIKYSVLCSQYDTFAQAEEKLYQKFSEYRDSDNFFLYNGNKIKRFKTIKENKIESGMPVVMNVEEDNSINDDIGNNNQSNIIENNNQNSHNTGNNNQNNNAINNNKIKINNASNNNKNNIVVNNNKINNASNNNKNNNVVNNNKINNFQNNNKTDAQSGGRHRSIKNKKDEKINKTKKK